jgi:outer membrane protein assembly factor BamB
MLLLPVAPPQPVPIHSGFDFVAVDAQRHRVYAAHTASSALLVVDTDSGKVLRQIRIGAVQGVAVDQASGHVYTGDGSSRTVSEVDPELGTVVHQVDIAGKVDAVAYDPALHHIYADEENGTKLFVIDARTMKQIGTVTLPGHKPEDLAVDPVSNDIYQNIADLGEYVVVDSKTLTVKQIVVTTGVTNNHPLQYDSMLGRVIVGGNGMFAVYDRHGVRQASGPAAVRMDQCDLDAKTHLLACAGGGMLTLYSISADAAPLIVAHSVVPRGVHTVAIDPNTGVLWVVWAAENGDFVQGYHLVPLQR